MCIHLTHVVVTSVLPVFLLWTSFHSWQTFSPNFSFYFIRSRFGIHRRWWIILKREKFCVYVLRWCSHKATGVFAHVTLSVDEFCCFNYALKRTIPNRINSARTNEEEFTNVFNRWELRVELWVEGDDCFWVIEWFVWIYENRLQSFKRKKTKLSWKFRKFSSCEMSLHYSEHLETISVSQANFC